MDMYSIPNLEDIEQISNNIKPETCKLIRKKNDLLKEIQIHKSQISDIEQDMNLKLKPLLDLCVKYRMFVMDQNCPEDSDFGVCDECHVLDHCPSCKKDFSE